MQYVTASRHCHAISLANDHFNNSMYSTHCGINGQSEAYIITIYSIARATAR